MRYVPSFRFVQEGRYSLIESVLDWIPPHIGSLSPYKPGKPAAELEREYGISGAIKVASNENPFGASPKAVESAARALADVNRYPDSGGFELKEALAAKLGSTPDRLVLGAGCNAVSYTHLTLPTKRIV